MVEDPVDAGFSEPAEGSHGYFWKRFEDFVENFRNGRDLDLSFFTDCPSHSEMMQHSFFDHYIREQLELLPTKCERSIVARDKNDSPAAVRIGTCQAKWERSRRP